MNSRLLKSLFLITSVLAFNNSSYSQFVSVLTGFNISVTDNTSSYGSALSFADFNGDGWDDLSFGTKDSEPKFFLNDEGNGFIPIDLGVLTGENLEINMLLWVDYDNDGDRDLFLSCYNKPIYLFNNDGNLNLTNVAPDVGLNLAFVENYGAGWGDINNDGLLDLYLCRYNLSAQQTYDRENRLFKQLPDGTFEDISISAGVNNGQTASFQPLFWDYDGDGWQDIFIIVDRLNDSNVMYRNLGNESFENVTAELGLEAYFDAMSIVLGDYDNDEDMDLFISNNPPANYLYQHNEDHSFTNVITNSGMNGASTCWGGVWIDYDNDGLLDLNILTAPLNNSLTPGFFYRNTGDGQFEDITTEVGLTVDDKPNYALAQADFDRDGREDMLVGTTSGRAKLYKNVTPEALDNHWLLCSFEGTISNRDAVGTSFKVYCDEDVYTRYTLCGESFLSQSSFNEHVGLGTHATIDSLMIRWPRGLVEYYYDLSVDTLLHFVEGQSLIPEFPDSPSLFACQNQSANIEIPQDDFTAILWSNGADSFSQEITEPGQYSATLFHPSGLVFQTDTLNFDFYPSPNPEFQVAPPSCYNSLDGSIELINSATEIQNMSWLNFEDTLFLSELEAGTYYYEGFDIHGCFFGGEVAIPNALQLLIEEQVTEASCFGTADGELTLILSDPEEFLSIQWSNGDTELVADSLIAGTYSYELIAQNECVYNGELNINSPTEPQLSISWEPSSNPLCPEIHYLLSFESDGLQEPFYIVWNLLELGDQPSTVEGELSIDCFLYGEVNLQITDANGCTVEIDEAFLPLLDIDELQTKSPSIFPNPSDGLIYFSSPIPPSPYSLFSTTGKLVNSGRINGQSLDLQGLAQGVYFLRIEGLITISYPLIIR